MNSALQLLSFLLLSIITSHLIYSHYYLPLNQQKVGNDDNIVLSKLETKIVNLETEVENNKKEITALRSSLKLFTHIFQNEVKEYEDKKKEELLKASKYGYNETTTVVSLSKSVFEVPTFVEYLYSLKTLKLFNNKISELPVHLFQQITELQSLQLGKNQITHIPEGILSNLKNIEDLLLGMNKLTEIPNDLIYLTKLKKLYIQNNQISSLTTSLFANLCSLEVLDIGYNRIDDLPFDIFSNLRNLKEVFLAGNQITQIPTSFYELTKLEFFSFSNNKIEHIDLEKLKNLTFLKSVDIRENNIHFENPERYFTQSNFPNLREVYLAGNLCNNAPCKDGNFLN